MPLNLPPDIIKDSYGGTDLHYFASTGDLSQVDAILKNQPEQLMQLTKSSISTNFERRRYADATVLHYALAEEQYDVAERLLTHPDCKKIINIANSATETILHIIVKLPDKEKALKLARIALNVEGININFSSSWAVVGPALFFACKNNNLEMVRLFLDQGANPNVIGGFDYGESLLNNLVEQLELAKDRAPIDLINAIMWHLIEKGADPQLRGPSGKTFFDYLEESPSALSKLDPKIKDSLQSTWKKSSPEEIEKGKKIYFATLPFTPDVGIDLQSPVLEDTALLVNLKKERRQAQQSDYDCTVLYGREQLDTFIRLAKLRFKATGQPFDLQFIMRPRKGLSSHVANGHLSFNAQGEVRVFWVDTLGHNDDDDDTRENNKAVGQIIRKHLPKAVLYTTDIPIQSTETGCHNIAMYISEQLSVVSRKNKDLFGDLAKIHRQNLSVIDGYRVIPWIQCPAYTGVPRIIQSTSKPKERLKKNLDADREPINKKNQNYQEAITPFLVEKNGKTVNSTYDTKRQKFGKYVRHAYENQYEELNKKRFAGFTDIVDGIPVDALAKELGINAFRVKGEVWEISMPLQYKGRYIAELRGTPSELSKQVEKAHEAILADKTAFKQPGFLFYYAALRTSRVIVDRLKIMDKKEEIQNDPRDKVSQGGINQSAISVMDIMAQLSASPDQANNVRKIETMLESIEALYQHGQKIGVKTSSGSYAMEEAIKLKHLTIQLAASFLPNTELDTVKITEMIQKEITDSYDNMGDFRSNSKPVLSYVNGFFMGLVGKRDRLASAEVFFSKTARQLKLEEIRSALSMDFSEEQQWDNGPG